MMIGQKKRPLKHSERFQWNISNLHNLQKHCRCRTLLLLYYVLDFIQSQKFMESSRQWPLDPSAAADRVHGNTVDREQQQALH